MAHYAKVENNIVTKVIVASADFFDDFIDTSPGEWVQTSYNTRGGKYYDQEGNEGNGVALRKNYAGIGFTYDRGRDAFYGQQPHDSWNLNEDTCQWEAPTPCPTGGKYYDWDEDTLSWIELTTET